MCVRSGHHHFHPQGWPGGLKMVDIRKSLTNTRRGTPLSRGTPAPQAIIVSAAMTKVQRHFHLQRPIDDALMEQIGRVNTIYGIERIRVEPSGNVMVEYDATRLNRAEVETVLERAGIPVAEVGA